MHQVTAAGAIKSETPTEIRIAYIGRKRVAYYRKLGTQSRYWNSLPVRQAEKALKDGRVHIGVFDSPAVAHVEGVA